MSNEEVRQIVTSRCQMNVEPAIKSRIKIELLFGEQVRLLDVQGDWAKVETIAYDKYQGYVPLEQLGEPNATTHRVCVVAAPLYSDPYFKSPLHREPLYMNSLVAIGESINTEEGAMVFTKELGWIFEDQLVLKEYKAEDYVNECLKFLGTSYGYERRGGLIDCSTLVQAGCTAAGIPCPYDVKSGEMETLGDKVDFDEKFGNLRRGDLVFWTQDKGSHVAIMISENECLHATIQEPYRKALIQPLAQVIIDQAKSGNGPVTSVRRFSSYTLMQ